VSDDTVKARQVRMLRTAMGPAISGALEEPDVVEVLLNPDGLLWVDRLSAGRSPLGVALSRSDAERIIRLIASHVGVEVHAGAPVLSAELPETGERFEGMLPPIAEFPIFAIRKRAAGVIPLEIYVRTGVISAEQYAVLREAIRSRLNILVAGGTTSGKTTFVNALLQEMAHTDSRVIVLEDTRELQCAAQNHVALRTKPGVVSLTELVRSTLRLAPDRIVVGEVRGPEALDMLKAWGTGHPGGISTIHAGSAHGALRRLEQLIQEAVITVPRALIAETINLIVFLVGRGRTRRVKELVRVTGLTADGYLLEPADKP
jgi:P-type conjugative transfer ATPase TrbB